MKVTEKAENGGLAAPPNCFICGRHVEEVPLHVQLEARRTMNLQVWLCSPGASKKHPLGAVRHSYCAPGSAQWLRHLDPADERGHKIARMYGLEGEGS